MLDTGNDDFNKNMQGVGSAAGLAPLPSPMLRAFELQVAYIQACRTLMRMNPFLALMLPSDKD